MLRTSLQQLMSSSNIGSAVNSLAVGKDHIRIMIESTVPYIHKPVTWAFIMTIKIYVLWVVYVFYHYMYGSAVVRYVCCMWKVC